MDKATINQLLIDSLRFDSDVEASAEMLETTKHWLASLITDNISRIRQKTHKSLSLYVQKAEFPSSDIEFIVSVIKGYCVKGAGNRLVYVSRTVEPLVNVVNISIANIRSSN